MVNEGEKERRGVCFGRISLIFSDIFHCENGSLILLIASKLSFESHSLTNDKLLLNNGTRWREISSVTEGHHGGN